jgi:hypothetical protein
MNFKLLKSTFYFVPEENQRMDRQNLKEKEVSLESEFGKQRRKKIISLSDCSL